MWNKLSAEVTYYHSNTKNQTFLGNLPEFTGYKQIYLQAGNVENRGWEASLGYNDKLKNGLAFSSTLTFSRNVNRIKEMVDGYHTDLLDDPIQISEVVKDGGRIILRKGGSIHDIYANTFLKKDHQGYVEIKSDGTFELDNSGKPVYLGKTSPDFNMGWNNSLSYKGLGLSFLLNGRFGGVVTSSTEALLDRFGVSKRSAEARDNGGALLPGQGSRCKDLLPDDWYRRLRDLRLLCLQRYQHPFAGVDTQLHHAQPLVWQRTEGRDGFLHCQQSLDVVLRGSVRPRTDSLYRHLRTRQRLLYAAKCA